jgi:uncharacterized protein YerC
MNKRLVWHKEDIQDVVRLLLDCKNKQEIEIVFDRILTPREINDIARRYKALTMIDEGKPYADIHLATGMSKVTISRLSAKCGFGFRKSAKLPKVKKVTRLQNTRTLKYKGVSVARVKK